MCASADWLWTMRRPRSSSATTRYRSLMSPPVAGRARPGRSRPRRLPAPRGSRLLPTTRGIVAALASRSRELRRSASSTVSQRSRGVRPNSASCSPWSRRSSVERVRVVVDAEVDQRVGEPRVAAVALDDEERRRLPAAAVATRGLGGVEAVEQPLGERPPPSPRRSPRARRRSRPRRGCCPAPRSRRPCDRPPRHGSPRPVNVAARPWPSTTPSCRSARSSSAPVRRATTSSADSPSPRRASPSGP